MSRGRVVAARVEPDPDYKNLKTLVVTLQVEDVLKGDAGKTMTFRQYIWDIRDISNAAGYRVGEEVLLFLNRPTSLGLVSPVGLEQGRFRVMTKRNGEVSAINGNGNAGLMRGVMESGALNTARLSAKPRATMTGFTEGAISLSALKESVRALVAKQAGAQ